MFDNKVLNSIDSATPAYTMLNPEMKCAQTMLHALVDGMLAGRIPEETFANDVKCFLEKTESFQTNLEKESVSV